MDQEHHTEWVGGEEYVVYECSHHPGELYYPEVGVGCSKCDDRNESRTQAVCGGCERGTCDGCTRWEQLKAEGHPCFTCSPTSDCSQCNLKGASV